MQGYKIRFRIHDLLFYLLLVFSFYYTRNMLCRLMMVVFFGYTVLQVIVKKRKVPLPFFYGGFLAFILYGAANMLLGNVMDAGVVRTMVVSLTLNFLMILAIVQYVYMTNDIPKVLRIAEFGIFSTALVVMLLSLGTITQGRLGGGTEINSNVLAILCVYGFIFAMYLRKIRKISLLATGLRMIFYLLIVLLTGSRKGLVMIVLAVLVVQLFMRRNRIRNILVGTGIAAVVFVLIMNVGFLYDIIGVRVESLVLLLTEGTTTEASLSDRQYLTQLGMAYVRENPWTGYGYDCFKLISGIGPYGKVPVGTVGFYSHNNYIELLFGGGVIGFVLYYIPVAYLLVKLFRNSRKDAAMPYLLAMVISLLSVEYARVTYYARVDAYITAIILGCALVAAGKERGKKRELTGELE